MNTNQYSAETSGQANAPRTVEDRRTISIVLAMILGFVVVASVLSDADADAPTLPAASAVTNDASRHGIVTGPLLVDVAHDSFTVARGDEQLRQ